MIGADFDTGEIALGGAVFDVEHADVCPAAVMICQRPGLKARAWKSRLLVPPPDRGDIVTYGGLVQLEAELAVGGGGRPQCDGSHAAACSGRSIRTPLLKTAPARTRATRWGALTDRQ